MLCFSLVGPYRHDAERTRRDEFAGHGRPALGGSSEAERIVVGGDGGGTGTETGLFAGTGTSGQQRVGGRWPDQEGVPEDSVRGRFAGPAVGVATGRGRRQTARTEKIVWRVVPAAGRQVHGRKP